GDADARSAKSTSRSSQSLAMSARVSAAFTTHVARPTTAAAPILRAFLGHPRAHKPHGNDRVCGTSAPPAGTDPHAFDHKPPGTSIAAIARERERSRPPEARPSPPSVADAGFSLDARRGRDRIT